MQNAFFSNLVKEGHALAPLVVEFNLFAADYIHESWLSEIVTPPVYTALKSSRRARRRLSGIIFRSAGLEYQYCFDFEEPARRLALLDGALLLKLSLFAGIAVNAARIAACIDRASVLAIRKTIGEDGYLFAMKRAPFLIRPDGLPDDACCRTDDIGADVADGGRMLLEACLGGAPRALTGRLRLKLPRERAGNWFADEPAVERQAAWPIVKNILFKEVDPAWAPCFS